MAQCLVARGDLYEDHVGGYSRAQKAPRTSSRRTYCTKTKKIAMRLKFVTYVICVLSGSPFSRLSKASTHTIFHNDFSSLIFILIVKSITYLICSN